MAVARLEEQVSLPGSLHNTSRPVRGVWRRAFARLSIVASSSDTPDHSARPLVGPESQECERFILRYQRQVLNYLWRMTGDRESAYDLTQEVFLRAWQRFDLISRYDQPLQWLFRVATNLALTHLKRRSSRVGSAAPLDERQDFASSDPAWRLAERDHVREILLQLPPKRRAALVLREVYGMTASEAGIILGMSETAVRMALSRAREQFRALYLREKGELDGE